MKETNKTHSVLLMEAARRILRPVGFSQKGRSRVWLSDQDWWAIVVEFQPSGFSRGSYLNVGCMWLWHVKPYISFDEGSRVEGFSQFQSEEQFRPIAAKLAQRAAEVGIHYRTLFPTVWSVSDFYLRNTPHVGWPSFNAAVAHGLCGRIEAAKRLFDCWGDEADDGPEWQKEARIDSKRLVESVGDQKGFRDLISTRVLETRELQKLSTRLKVDF